MQIKCIQWGCACLLALYAGMANAQKTARLPMEQVKGLTYITCSIGDSGPLHCLLDTGSSATGVAPDVVRRLHLKTHTDAQSPRPDLLAIEPFTVHAGEASWPVTRTTVAPADLSLLDKESGEGFQTDVVLGTDILKSYQVTFNPLAKQVQLDAPGTPVAASAEKLMAMYVQHIPFAILQIKANEGHAGIGPFSVDSGSRPELMLSHAFWSTRSALAEHNLSGAENQRKTLDGVLFGMHELKDVHAYEPLHEGGLVASRNVGGVIGAPILNRFIMTFDEAQNSIWITPLPTH